MRTDIHSPTNLDPAKYRYVGIYIISQSADPVNLPGITAYIKNNEHIGPHGMLGRCDHCGNLMTYNVIFEHEDGGFITVGETCAAERFALPDRHTYAMKTARNAMAAAKRKETKDERFEQLLSLNPTFADALAWAKEVDGRMAVLREQTNDASKRAEVDTLARLVGFQVNTLIDMGNNAYRWDNVTEKMLDFAERLHAEGIENLERAEDEIQQSIEMEPLDEGRRELAGTILTVKSVDTRYGVSNKMLVELPTGHRVYGSVPRALEDESFDKYDPAFDSWKGAEVVFTAEVSRKDGVNDFGFFSRPTKARFTSFPSA